MRAVDTNILVRLIVRDDDDQVARAEAFVAGGAWISHVVLVEAVWVLASVYDRTSTQIREAVTLLLDHATLVVEQSDLVRAAAEAFSRRPKVAFSDHLILELARRSGNLPLGTFDRTLGTLEDAQRL